MVEAKPQTQATVPNSSSGLIPTGLTGRSVVLVKIYLAVLPLLLSIWIKFEGWPPGVGRIRNNGGRGCLPDDHKLQL